MGYYFISIGGSGARVLESLTHLCAAGLLPNKEGKGRLYAMSIDPDTGNGNLVRTHRLLNCLNHFQGLDVGTETPLLKTPLAIANPFYWSPAPTDKNLDGVMAFPAFEKTPVGKLYRTLYTKEERDTTLNEGFRGRPSIGAAVMAKNANDFNAVKKATAWHNLVTEVNSDVATHGSAQIFLAGSIFGGTGAAGLPTIARLLREAFKKNCENGTVRIGGALLLPYFSFNPTEEDIKNSGLFAYSDHFLTNTKAALRYYADNGGSGYDSIYFLGDGSMMPTKNFSVGASTQCNDAHIVDLFAATAALHFYTGKNFGANTGNLYYLSRQSADKFRWSDFPNVKMEDNTTQSVKELFVQFTRFILAYLHIVKPVFADLEAKTINSKGYAWYRDYLEGKVKSDSSEVTNFEQYAESFALWVSQIEKSVGVHSVELINPESFSIDNGKVKVEPKEFSSLDFGTSEVTIDAVINNLTRGGGFIGRLLGMVGGNNQQLGTDFGCFLRRLYDSCAVSPAN